MKSRICWNARLSGLALLVGAFAALLGGSLVPSAAAAASCTPARNIEGIVDDSGSMSVTDPNNLRVQAIDLLMATLSPSTYLGVVDFGSEGGEGKPATDNIFPPEPIGPNEAAMQEALSANIIADNGKTDYNAAFAGADAANPTSQARIFLTDGGHDVGTYNEAHLAHPVPTYVIGFAVALALPESTARLEKIAADTGGAYYPVTDVAELQTTMNKIATTLSCQGQLTESNDFFATGTRRVHHVRIKPGTKVARIALSWASPKDSFAVSEFKLVRRHHVTAQALPSPNRRINGRPKILRVVEKRGTTFLIDKVSHLHPGILYFTVSATQVRSEPRVKTVTQVGFLKHH